jgi:septal ring factor EnvC (AmiA/AmiB activator)
MSQPSSDRNFLPILLTTLSVLVVFSYQLSINSRFKTEQEALSKQIDEIQRQREPLVEQSKKVQTGLQAIAEDLLKLAATDEDAAALIKQFNIQRNEPATPAAPAP